MLQEPTQPIPIPIKFTCAFGGTILHPMADPAARVNVATVPCKYKVGRVLGQGTYAVVKGASIFSIGSFYRGCAYWHRKVLCRQGHQQAANGRQRTYGPQRDCCLTETLHGSRINLDTGRLL